MHRFTDAIDIKQLWEAMSPPMKDTVRLTIDYEVKQTSVKCDTVLSLLRKPRPSSVSK
jgi:hypothetical protein